MSAIPTGLSEIVNLAQKIFDKCDINRDGNLTAEEFQSVLSDVLSKGSLVNRPASQSSTSSAAYAAGTLPEAVRAALAAQGINILDVVGKDREGADQAGLERWIEALGGTQATAAK